MADTYSLNPCTFCQTPLLLSEKQLVLNTKPRSASFFRTMKLCICANNSIKTIHGEKTTPFSLCLPCGPQSHIYNNTEMKLVLNTLKGMQKIFSSKPNSSIKFQKTHHFRSSNILSFSNVKRLIASHEMFEGEGLKVSFLLFRSQIEEVPY